MIKLRQYQFDVLKQIHSSVMQGNNPCVVLPCRSGKSYIIASICERTKDNVLVLAHRIELLKQLEQLLGSYSNVRLASVFTEVRHLSDHKFTPKYIVIDEAHLSEAMTYKKICEYYSGSTRILFTATPARLDGKPLSLADELIVGTTMRELIEMGNISDFDYYAPDIGLDLSNVDSAYGEYNIKQLADVVCNSRLYGNVLKYYNELAKNKQAIAYCVNIKHAQQVAERFKNAGISAIAISSKTLKKERENALNGFKEGKYTILCNCNLISEGITLPMADVALLLRPTQSLPLFIQQSCRVLTPAENKKAIIIDFAGNYQRHGLPDEKHEWSLKNKLEKKRNSNADGTFTLRTCEKCYKVFKTAPVCPYCGAEYKATEKEIKQGESVELQRITEEKNAKMERKKKEMRMEVGRCRTLNDLWKIQKQRGYNPAWVWRMAKVKGIKR